MSHYMLKFALLLASGVASLAMFNTAQAEEYRIDINKTEVLHLPYTAGAVVIGNPEIADVSVHSQNVIFLIGKGYGETNLIILDNDGQTLMNADIKVGHSASKSAVRIIKIGQGNESYNCSPYCLQAPSLGDNAEFKQNFQGSASNVIANTTVNAASFSTGVSGNSAIGANNFIPTAPTARPQGAPLAQTGQFGPQSPSRGPLF